MLVITIVVLMCAFVLHFSPLFALIPASLLAGVLAFGGEGRQAGRSVGA